MGEQITRPVQFNITNHINKCMQEAIQQRQWIEQGGTYYEKTIDVFKERMNQLLDVAEIYRELYNHFSSGRMSDYIQPIRTTCNEAASIPVRNISYNNYANIVDDDDLTDLSIQDTTSVVITNQITSNFDIVNPLSGNESLTQLTSIEALNKLIEDKKNWADSKSIIQTSTYLKFKLGCGIDRLSALSSTSPESIFNDFKKLICTWYSNRCDWPKHDVSGRIKYNLASFNKSLDAIILAYSSQLFKTSFHEENAEQFNAKMIKWLHDEGENHKRGQPDPYSSEHNGLVSSEIRNYSEGTNSYFDPLLKLPDDNNFKQQIYCFAIYAENKIKPVIYEDSISLLKQNPPLANLYFHSLRNRVQNTYYPNVSNISDSDICKMFEG